MRIKHFAGYGCIDAKVTHRKLNTQDRTRLYVVEVTGNHEYGLDVSDDKYRVINWLGKVIKDAELNGGIHKTGPDGYNFMCNLTVRFEYLASVRKDNCDVERGAYVISYRY